MAVMNLGIGPSPFLATGVAVEGTGHHNIWKIIKLLESVQRREHEDDEEPGGEEEPLRTLGLFSLEELRGNSL